MITAIPMSAGQIPVNFSQADTIVLLADNGQVIEHFPNPASAGHCIGKNALTVMLRQKHVSRVLVRNVGQCMLATLLQMSFEVYQVPRDFIPEVMTVADLKGFVQLVRVQQGKSTGRCKRSTH